MRPIHRYRRNIVVPSGRRYAVCGLAVPPRPSPSARAIAMATWLPVSTLVVLMLVSMYAVANPVAPQHAVARVTAYSFEDFASAARR